MRQVVIESAGGYDHLRVREGPNPVPSEGEVLIQCKAAGVNFADCCVRMGIYRSAKIYVGWPITPGFEVAGFVEAVGEGVTRFRPGDRVIGVTRFGGYTSHLVIPENQVFPLPDTLDFTQGAAFPAVFLTAYYGLFELANPHEGDTLLVHSAAGGVGGALVQLGKVANCQVIGVVGASHKVDSVKDLGADHVIDKSSQKLWPAVKKWAPNGCDVILDANGAETLNQGYRHLAPGGKLVVYGFHSMLSKGRGTPNWLKVAWDFLRTPRFNPLDMTTDNHSILAFNLSYLFDRVDRFQSIMARVSRWFEEGKIVPPFVTTYPLENVQAAHRDLESGQTTGKLVLMI